MYARLVTFYLQDGKAAIASDLADDLVPAISEQPGCVNVTCFGDSESGRFFVYVLWKSAAEADAAAAVISPRLEKHLAGNIVSPPQKQLYPVLAAA